MTYSVYNIMVHKLQHFKFLYPINNVAAIGMCAPKFNFTAQIKCKNSLKITVGHSRTTTGADSSLSPQGEQGLEMSARAVSAGRGGGHPSQPAGHPSSLQLLGAMASPLPPSTSDPVVTPLWWHLPLPLESEELSAVHAGEAAGLSMS